ncbi:hypothetical protein GW17_00041780 [Ensete ventricosum]|nr:hypothetical protein GW17_00041780 [Ensete ventricosum]
MTRGYGVPYDADGACNGKWAGASFGWFHLGCRRGRRTSAIEPPPCVPMWLSTWRGLGKQAGRTFGELSDVFWLSGEGIARERQIARWNRGRAVRQGIRFFSLFLFLPPSVNIDRNRPLTVDYQAVRVQINWRNVWYLAHTVN